MKGYKTTLWNGNKEDNNKRDTVNKVYEQRERPAFGDDELEVIESALTMYIEDIRKCLRKEELTPIGRKEAIDKLYGANNMAYDARRRIQDYLKVGK